MLNKSQEDRRRFMALAAATGATALAAGCGTRAPLPGQAPASAAYRREAATHLYRKYADRIYRGKLPPMLYAIGVFEVELSQGGRVGATRWLRGLYSQ